MSEVTSDPAAMSEITSDPAAMSEVTSDPAVTPVAAPPRRSFDRSRLRLGIVIAVIAAAIAFLALQGLGSATTYFYNVDEVDAADLVGDRIRLQGTPPEEADVEGDTVRFDLEYRCAVVPVVHRGDPPELFRAGTPVVLEGEFDEGGTFRSDRIMVRHTTEYREENGENIAAAARDAGSRC